MFFGGDAVDAGSGSITQPSELSRRKYTIAGQVILSYNKNVISTHTPVDRRANMKILNITAQKPSSTGSGVFLSELVRVFAG